ncbi:Plasma-membrane_choline transporter [Hexamita inflata]|uniref:Plasma-membrane choline transporter n=1 Tax=Hexamita inflata TaxID=28002 RepID=A0AA86QGJ0_9EUKA|nr:Plasma-membrane choline transporter [Hexamita inflata]
MPKPLLTVAQNLHLNFKIIATIIYQTFLIFYQVPQMNPEFTKLRFDSIIYFEDKNAQKVVNYNTVFAKGLSSFFLFIGKVFATACGAIIKTNQMFAPTIFTLIGSFFLSCYIIEIVKLVVDINIYFYFLYEETYMMREREYTKMQFNKFTQLETFTIIFLPHIYAVW